MTADQPVLDPVILSKYIIGALLGKGSYGIVFAATDKKTHENVALKIISKEKLGSKGEKSVRMEINVMMLLQHPKILRLHNAFFTDKNIVLSLDHVVGGELFQHLLKLDHYSERTAAKVMYNLLVGIKYMHDEGIVHRDLKPDNMLLTRRPQKREEVTDVKIADFGFATKFKGAVLTQPCGTPYYLAPEVLQVGVYKSRSCYNELVDLWSAGVIAYILLSGHPPFNGKDKQGLFRNIVKGDVNFTQPVWKVISWEAKDFILHLLKINPRDRFSAEKAMKHAWISSAEETKPDVHLQDSIEDLKKFNAREKIKGAVYGVEAALRLLYLGHCQEQKVKPNSSIVEALTAATQPIQTINLSNNYLGVRGTELLINLIASHTEVRDVNLSNIILEDEQCGRIVAALSRPSCRVCKLAFDDNPLSHTSGRRILGLLQARRHIVQCTVERTHMSACLKKKIESQANHNRQVLSARPVPAHSGMRKPATADPAILRHKEQQLNKIHENKVQNAARSLLPCVVHQPHTTLTPVAKTTPGVRLPYLTAARKQGV